MSCPDCKDIIFKWDQVAERLEAQDKEIQLLREVIQDTVCDMDLFMNIDDEGAYRQSRVIKDKLETALGME